ncbi:hypothetical protein ACIPJU_08970 [Micrococcus endophyticus]
MNDDDPPPQTEEERKNAQTDGLKAIYGPDLAAWTSEPSDALTA